MILWLDAHLSPQLQPWIAERFKIEVHPVRDLKLHTAKDLDIFFAAREAGAIVMTKDADFLALLDKHGPPPQILWLTCGNTSNARLRKVLFSSFDNAIRWLKAGEPLVEISGK